MKKSRLYYIFLFFAVIFLGILSRKTSIIPLCFGDFLYAVMMFLLIRIFFINKKGISIAILSLTICYCIEFLQLYQDEWIVELRQTLFGRYVLGQGFLCSDILAYTFGVAIAFLTEKLFLRNNSTQKSA